MDTITIRGADGTERVWETGMYAVTVREDDGGIRTIYNIQGEATEVLFLVVNLAKSIQRITEEVIEVNTD